MSDPPTLDRILTSLHDASLDDTLWPTTSALLDEVCQTKGNFLTLAEGQYPNDVDTYIVRFYFRGERHDALEREYFDTYYSQDERIPRFLQLPDSHLVHATDLYTNEELNTSAAYNEALSRGHSQNTSTCVSMVRTARASPGPPPIPSMRTGGRRLRSNSSGSFCPICVNTYASGGRLPMRVLLGSP